MSNYPVYEKCKICGRKMSFPYFDEICDKCRRKIIERNAVDWLD